MTEPANPRRVSPLGNDCISLHSGDGQTVFEAGPVYTSMNLRGRVENSTFLQRVSQCCGHELPLTANHWNGDREYAALWLGPDEWLLLAPQGADERIIALESICREDPWASVVDVSHMYCSLLVGGYGATELLAKGCYLDLYPPVFPPGSCCQTTLAKAPVIMRVLHGAPCYEILVRNSYSRYLAAWIHVAMGTGKRD